MLNVKCLRLCKSEVFLFYSLEHLFGKAFHSLYRRVSALLVDVLEFDYGHIIVAAHFHDRIVYVVLELAVEDEVNVDVWIVQAYVVEHLCHGRTEIVEVGTSPVAVLVFAHLHSSP